MLEPVAQTIVPAATVVIFRQPEPSCPPELLMVQRSSTMRFAGGAAVFPGGKVDPADIDLARNQAPYGDVAEIAARIAAVRETLEETGLAIGLDRTIDAAHAAQARAMLLQRGEIAPVLGHFGWSLALDRLVPFARWCPQHTRAFDTWFYLADLGTGAVELSIDQTENTRLFWATATQALAMADGGEISIIYPTRRNLERLAQFGNFAAACADAASHSLQLIIPVYEQIDGESWLIIPHHAAHGYPVRGEPRATAKRG